jgi:hypothetical protein
MKLIDGWSVVFVIAAILIQPILGSCPGIKKKRNEATQHIPSIAVCSVCHLWSRHTIRHRMSWFSIFQKSHISNDIRRVHPFNRIALPPPEMPFVLGQKSAGLIDQRYMFYPLAPITRNSEINETRSKHRVQLGSRNSYNNQEENATIPDLGKPSDQAFQMSLDGDRPFQSSEIERPFDLTQGLMIRSGSSSRKPHEKLPIWSVLMRNVNDNGSFSFNNWGDRCQMSHMLVWMYLSW